MARYDVPRPKRKDFTHRTFSGKWFDQRSYDSAVAEWERGRDEFNERQRSSGRGTSDGDRWTADDGTTHTVNSTLDPNVPGGYYHSQTDEDGNKATAVFNGDGSLADIKQNKDWRK